MPKKRGRPAKKKGTTAAEKKEDEPQEPVVEKNAEVQEPIAEDDETEYEDPEMDRQIAAIRALRDMQVEQLRTKLQLLRSHISKEDLDLPVLQFFKEKLPHLEIVENEKDGHYAVREKSDQEPSHGGFEFSNQSVKTSYFGVDTMQIRAFDLGEQSEAASFEWQDKFQTPDVSNQRLSIGVTPKTKRLPKHGEVLLSVHGSPLGVFKEDNMEAIDEVEDS